SFLLDLMIKSKPGAHRIKGTLPNDAVIAHKTGTSGTDNGITAACNDVGIVTLPDGKHVALAIFVSDSSADEAAREGVIAQIARAAWDNWSGGRD
ncbi:MAG: serine hydrolase, partial [Chthoniobacterales bacterium]